mgnify:CR=1 FL=1
MAEQPFAGMVPATVADIEVIALAAPDVTVAMVLIPAPDVATFIVAAPPPPAGILPLYD